jgi:RsiW-degrading membrane proteinase PrsW (M82 family)
MIDDMINYFKSFFQDPAAWGIAVALGAVWLTCYWPPLFRKPWLWAVLVSSAFITLVTIRLIGQPLYHWIYAARNHFENQEVLRSLFDLAVIPLGGGLFQEGSKLVPVVVWWRRSGKNLDPKLGLIIGAVAGAGFGMLGLLVVTPQWFWAWHYGNFFVLGELFGFWHIVFIMAAQIAFSALAGYGLARGRGWQFYLIASALHGLMNLAGAPGLFSIWEWGYSYSSGEIWIYTAVLAAVVTAWALWLRWRKTAATAEPEISSP